MKLHQITTILSLFLIMGVSACTSLKPGCIAEDKIVEIGTSAIVIGGECEGQDAVKKWVKSGVDKVGLCPNTGPIANAVCPSIAKSLVAELASVPPADWKCKLTNFKATAQGLIETGCKLIPVKK